MRTDVTATGPASPIVVDGLAAGDYVFTVAATDRTGTRQTRRTTVPVAVTQVLNPSAALDVRGTATASGRGVSLGRTTGIRPPPGSTEGTAFTIDRRGEGGPGPARVFFAVHAPTGLSVGSRVTVSLWALNRATVPAPCGLVLANARGGATVSGDAVHATVLPNSGWLRVAYDTTVSTRGGVDTGVLLQLPADGPLALEVAGVSVTTTAVPAPTTSARTSGADVTSFTGRGPVGPAGAYRLLHGDDFTGTGLDRTRWWDGRYRTGSTGDPAFNPAGEAECFAAAQVSVAASLLTLTADRRAGRVDGVDYTYRSGCVTSSPGLRFTPVGTYVEARIRVDAATGLWPAFWMASATGYFSEFDIFEFVSTDTDVRPSYNYHYAAAGSAQADRQTYLRSYGEPGHVYPGDFHTYGLLTTATSQTPYLDGIAYRAAAVTGLATCNDPVEIIFSLAVKKGRSPVSGHAMDVDWLRVWRAV